MKIILSSWTHRYWKKFGIFLIAVVLVMGLASCEGSCGSSSLYQYVLAIFSTAGGVTTPGAGTFNYNKGTLVNLVATPASGYRFVKWTGNVSTIADVYAAATNITINGDYSITAKFVAIYNLTISSTEGGEVTAPGPGTFNYDCATVVDLMAEAEAGYRFVNWTGNVATIANVSAASTTITMNGNYSITANFIAQYDLTINSTSGGEVTTPGEGTCAYDAGTVVNLLAEAEAGYQFVNWTGNGNTIANADAATTTITMNGDYSITANFEQIPPEQFTLTISNTAGGSVTAPGEGTRAYDAGTVVDLVATPASGYRFVNWTGDVGTVANVSAALTTITMNGNYSITANFIIVQYDLMINSTNGGEVITPGEGAFTYDAGTVVNLLAEAEAGYQFVNWTGNVNTIANADAATTTITINGSYSISANFEEITGDRIWDWYDLDAIRDNLAGSYILMNDLDSTSAGYTELASETANEGKGWEPIGTIAVNDTFVGSFNGQGNVICDLFIDRPDESDVGIFSVVGEGGVIENVGLMNVTVTGYNGVGGLVGYNSGNVSNSYCSGRVTGGRSVGGLVGHNNGNVNDSYCTGRVTGGLSVGGLVGHNSGNVSNSYCSGRVTGGWGVGGLVGHNNGNVSNSYCTSRVTGGLSVGGLAGQNEGTASNCSSSGSVIGNNYVGGLVGQNKGTASNCSSSGSVTGNNYVGGLVGTNGGTVSDSYSTSSATGNTRVGGLVGQNSNAVSNSYATGSVTGNDRIGGLVGINKGTVSNSFWDTQTSGQATSAGGIGKATAQMKEFTTFSVAGWNIIAVANSSMRNTGYIWNIVDSVTYPFLSWRS